MFGMQRIGDLVWLAGDMRVKGFMVGGTAGRTTLNGEGLQHEDGHSHLLAYPVPNLEAYDPAFGYEIAVIIREGIRRMYVEQEDVFYYLTVENDIYAMPAMPDGVEEGILKGMYKFKPSAKKRARLKAHLFGSGAIINSAPQSAEPARRKIPSQRRCLEHHQLQGPAPRRGSMPSVGTACIRRKTPSQLHRTIPSQRTRCVRHGLGLRQGPPRNPLPAGFPTRPSPSAPMALARSETREALRDHFEVDYRFIALGALSALAREGQIECDVVVQAMQDLEIDPAKTQSHLPVSLDHPMPVKFALPDLGENIESGDVIRILVDVGDRLAEDQTVIELETDKAVIEVPSSIDGTITEILVQQGDTIAVGQPISRSRCGRSSSRRGSIPGP